MLAFAFFRNERRPAHRVHDAARTRAQNEIAPSTPAVEDALRFRGPRRIAVMHQWSDYRSTSATAFELLASRPVGPHPAGKACALNDLDVWAAVPTGEAHRLS